MSKKRLHVLLILFILTFSIGNLSAQLKIIIDTDIGGDADDLGALVMLHNFVKHGECELLAVISWSNEIYAVSAIDAINRYYDHPDIPIAGGKEDTWHDEWQYNKPIAESFPHECSYKNVPDPTELYRRILAGQPDFSVVIVTVGPLYNIQLLINSGPDSLSALTGSELFSKKVRECVIMGGEFPEGKGEWNFYGNRLGVTKFVLENLKVPVVFSGFEIGERIKTGAVFNDINKNTPLYVGWLHFCQHAPWMPPYEGRLIDNASYDQTAVLYAVRGGIGKYWEKVSGGYCAVSDSGNNQWIQGEITNQSYLKLIEDPENMATLIESIMLDNFEQSIISISFGKSINFNHLDLFIWEIFPYPALGCVQYPYDIILYVLNGLLAPV
jgi:inosine-uridine nucleoside N-ribohydrolase